MRGIAMRRKHDHQFTMAGAWWTEFFRREGKQFGRLGKYLKKLEKRGSSNAELAAAFKAMSARGLKVKVRRIPKGQ